MADYTELKERLRRCDGRFDISPDLHGEAADAIEALEKELDRTNKLLVMSGKAQLWDAAIRALKRPDENTSDKS